VQSGQGGAQGEEQQAGSPVIANVAKAWSRSGQVVVKRDPG